MLPILIIKDLEKAWSLLDSSANVIYQIRKALL